MRIHTHKATSSICQSARQKRDPQTTTQGSRPSSHQQPVQPQNRCQSAAATNIFRFDAVACINKMQHNTRRRRVWSRRREDTDWCCPRRVFKVALLKTVDARLGCMQNQTKILLSLPFLSPPSANCDCCCL